MENQEILQAMFEEATLGILVVNSDGAIQNANPFSEKLFGYEQGELLGQPVEMLLPEAFRTTHIQHRKKYHQHPSPRSMGSNLELSGQRKDGSQFPVEISLSYTKVKNKKLAIAYINDISYKKNIIKDLQIKNTAFSEGAMPIKFTDLEGNIKEVNNALVKLWGYENPDELIGMNFENLASDKLSHRDRVNDILKNGSWVGEAMMKKKDGSEFNLYATASLIINEQGSPTRMLFSVTDITLLKEAENYTEAILSSIAAQMAVINPQGEIINVNKSWGKFASKNTNGQISGTGIGINYIEVCKNSAQQGDKDAAAIEKGIVAVLNDEIEEFQLVYPCDSATKKRWFLLQVRPLSHVKKGAVIVHLNITAQKAAEEKLRLLNAELEEKVELRTQKIKQHEVKLEASLAKEKELNELKSRFVSMASHEFRTPLTSILSSANIIGRYEEKEEQDKRMKHVKRIAASVKNLTNILNDFLSLEKLESGTLRFQPISLDFQEYVESMMDEINLLSNGKQKIVFHHSGNKEVRIDEHLVKNVMINLLSNAVKYSPAGKDVELISKNKNGCLEISVKDKGIGIPKADHEHMFSRFFRATNVENIQGTGLGLTIVKRYLDLMNGEIDFESEEYKGTTFRVKIPQ